MANLGDGTTRGQETGSIALEILVDILSQAMSNAWVVLTIRSRYVELRRSVQSTTYAAFLLIKRASLECCPISSEPKLTLKSRSVDSVLN